MSTSAVGVRDLMQEDNLVLNGNKGNPVLRRMKSERSTLMSYDDISVNNSSLLTIPTKKNKVFDDKESSILSISFVPPPPPPLAKVATGKKGKASSVINGAELRDDKSIQKGKGKASSVVSDSVFSKDSHHKAGINGQEPANGENVVTSKPGESVLKPIKTSIGPWKANSILSESEVGPSPSEVAAAMAERRYPLEQEGSSVMDGWSVDESVEGLRSKLERWRTELPTSYDHGGYASSSFRSSSYHTRRHTDGGSADGLFSCFGNVFGYECECVCGQPPPMNNDNYICRSPSVGSLL